MILGEKYEEIMDRVVVTDAMRQRILRNIQNANLQPRAKVIHFPHWQRYAAAAACFSVLLIGALTVPTLLHPLQGNPAVSAPDENAPVVGTQEIVECRSADELSKEVGFPVSDRTVLPFTPTSTSYISLFGKIAEINYTGADGQSATCRKSLGTDNNSGIYDFFPSTEQLTVGRINATVKGDGTQYTIAEWTDGTYAYSIALSSGVGIDVWHTIIQGTC